MRRLRVLTVGSVIALVSAACGQPAGSLQAAADALGAASLKSVEFSGSGRWFQFGQAPNPTLPWPQFDVSTFKTAINYETPSARVEMTRLQTVEPGRLRPGPVEQKPVQLISASYAWNLAVPADAQPDAAPVPQAQPATVEERMMEIWSTPQGFVKAALANNATSQPANGGSEVSFTVGKNRYVGTINAQSHVARVQTWIDNPVLGDTPVETTFSNYRDFGGLMFPSQIVRIEGGYPVLDITVSDVKANPAVDITVPGEVRTFTPPPVLVEVQKLANGVYYLTGGSHHSLAIDQRDHVVVVEGPQNEDRSLAVIAKVKETIPGKPIRFVINTHAHFDHSGGLRTYVDEGATVVTHQMNQPYYEQAWAAPRTLNPDRLAQSKKRAMFETFTDKHVLTDGKRSIEIYEMTGSGHNDAFLMVYLPAERILVEADSWSPPLGNAPPQPPGNPFTVNLYDNVQRLKLPVRTIAAIHGPGVKPMADLKAAAMPAAVATK